MYIVKLTLKNFRNYNSLNIEFLNGLNVIIGNNAQGKTNILEAIYVLGLTKTFSSSLDRSTIKIGSDFSIVMGKIFNNDISDKLEIIISGQGKVVKINDVVQTKISDYISKLRVITFIPQNIGFINDFPSVRRKFINVEICQISNIYLRLLNDYNILLKQRNFYLKKIVNDNYDYNYLSVLDDKLIQIGYKLYLHRNDFIYKINNYIGDIFLSISGISGLVVKYVSVASEFNEYENTFKSNLDRDIHSKTTLVGIHRDDFIFELNRQNLALYGSQGQMRLAILALRLSELYVYRDYGLDEPVLLLDDIFSELDIEKRNKLTKYLKNKGQVIITTTDIEMINKDILKRARIFNIEDGKIKQVIKEEML